MPHAMLGAVIVLCVCVVVLGAIAASPARWIVVAGGALAFLLALYGGIPLARGETPAPALTTAR